ncbi:MAG TPA: Uma2 family endonuclease [Saprospiraceae bacterium]|nr:Uma2 family endonuclease [Saprospiraceae bacterium]
MHEEIIIQEAPVVTVGEYLDMEARSAVKHEFDNGKLIEMAGGDIAHNLVKGEIFSLLKIFIESARLPFLVLDSDMKTWFPSLGKFVYPDVTVIAKPPQFYIAENGKVRRDAIVNPTLIVEVLSEDTRDYDKGEKFDYYCTLESFREYVLVEPEKTWIKTVYLEDPANGLQRVKTFTDPEAILSLQSIGCDIRVADIYKVLEGLIV